MARDMQDKILSGLQKAVEKAGFEWVKKPAYANTGRIYVQPKDGFDTALSFCYSFQSGYCTIQFYPGDFEPVATCGFTHEKCVKDFHYLQYTEAGRIREAISFVTEYLKKQGVKA